MSKFVEPKEAAALIPDGAKIGIGGFVTFGAAASILRAVGARYAALPSYGLCAKKAARSGCPEPAAGGFVIRKQGTPPHAAGIADPALPIEAAKRKDKGFPRIGAAEAALCAGIPTARLTLTKAGRKPRRRPVGASLRPPPPAESGPLRSAVPAGAGRNGAARSFGNVSARTGSGGAARLAPAPAVLLPRSGSAPQVPLGLVAGKDAAHLPEKAGTNGSEPHGNVLMHRRFAASKRCRRSPHGGPVLYDVLAEQDGPALRLVFHNRSLPIAFLLKICGKGREYVWSRENSGG